MSLQVRSSQSPWYPYLTAVYGPNVPLPFNMHALRFIRHHTEGRPLPPTLPTLLPRPCTHGVRPRGRSPSKQPRSELAAPRLRSEDARILRTDPGAEIFAEIFAGIS